uniref:F-box/FBD/LRR-repeat protein At1g13570-like n=1 Tax=Erigeron canadensis TaxID=72917 RepID=UPI001CB9A306|nr:F-box/FBD/LRR-repeat protein At1g13570-like [Erigeron canadensis]
MSGGTTTLPSDLIEKILWELPTKELVRTSILSKEWRYRWTRIPEIAFKEDLIQLDYYDLNDHQLPIIIKEQQKNMRCRFFNTINQYLVLHQGPILAFTLSMETTSSSADDTSIKQILLDLSRKNTVKKLRLSLVCLSSSIFSFHQLTHLHLSHCSIYNQPASFNGFGSLTTLCLEDIYINNKALVDILSHSPLLKSFSMHKRHDNCDNHNPTPTINDLFNYLPLIEHLGFCVRDFQWLKCIGRGEASLAPATPFVRLKSLCLEGMCFLEENSLRCLLHMIRSSPNLEKLKLQNMLCGNLVHWNYYFDDAFYPVTMQDYSHIRLEHLIELEIEHFYNKKPNREFVKLILAKSPVLKTVRLMVHDKDEELKMLRSLVHAPRASPMVEIIGDYGGGKERS